MNGIEILTTKNIIVYLIVINLFTFFIMFWDKKKAENGGWRIRENTLFMLCAIGGSIGGIAGMYTFRHKTKKSSFVIGFPAILILQIAIAIYLLLA